MAALASTVLLCGMKTGQWKRNTKTELQPQQLDLWD